MSYDRKYKERVLEYLKEGHTQRETAALFKISTNSIWKWQQSLATTGSLETKKRKRPAKKLPRQELMDYISAHPDAYLSEIAEHFGCSGTAVSKALKILKITRKKKRKNTGSVMKNAVRNFANS
jgi:transposase